MNQRKKKVLNITNWILRTLLKSWSEKLNIHESSTPVSFTNKTDWSTLFFQQINQICNHIEGQNLWSIQIVKPDVTTNKTPIWIYFQSNRRKPIGFNY